MKRKQALLAQFLAHLTVDLACSYLLFSRLPAEKLPAGALIFLLITFSLRPFLGLVLDTFPNLQPQAAGCALVSVGTLLPSSWWGAALVLAALGSALFHTGAAGESICFARGLYARAAIVFAPGAIGVALGQVCAAQPILALLPALTVPASAVLCFLFTDARKYPRRIRAFASTVRGFYPPWAVLLLTLIITGFATLSRSILPAQATGWDLLGLAVMATLGRLVGGFAADRFGPRKTLMTCFAAALPCMTVFVHIPWIYAIGIGLLAAPFAVMLGNLTASLPQNPHFAFGILSLAIMAGSLPAFVTETVTNPMRYTASGLILICLLASSLLNTDFCRRFAPPRKVESRYRKEERK